MEIAGMIAASVLVGLVVGVLSGMLGIGGGTLLVPTFKLGFLMDAIASTATSLFTIIPTSVSGAVSHLRNKTCIPKLGLAAGLGGACTSPVGVWLATLSPSWLIMAVAALIIGYSAYTMLMKALKMGKGKKENAPRVAAASADAGTASASASGAPAPSPSAADVRIGVREVAIGAGIGLFAGVASGYVGVGGGFIMVPLMVQLIGIPMRLTSGTSLIAVMILAIPGVVMQGALGNVDWIAGIAVACGSIPGAAVGARLVTRIPERALRFIFSGFLFVAAILLILEEAGVL